MRGSGALLGLALAALACAPGPERLEGRFPELARHDGHRLDDAQPHLLPHAGGLTRLLCRWPDGAVLPVALPPGADARQRRQLEAALAGWERAGLGLRFEPGAADPAIEIELRDDLITAQANTVSDCAVDAAALTGPPAGPLPARLVHASVQLSAADLQLTGTALHELGHALGFQGHARRGATVMLRDFEAVRRAGERAARGGPWRDAALSALYALPSGAVLGRQELPAGHTRSVDRLLARGRREGWTGPLLQVGDRLGTVRWLGPGGGPVWLWLEGVHQARADPARLRIELSRAAARLAAE